MDYEAELKKLRDEQIAMTRNELEMQKQNSISTLNTQIEKLKPQYELQRQQASVSSQLGGKNFAEYLASRGLTSSGVGVQGELARQNQLGQTMNTINTNENTALQDIQNQKNTLESDYNLNLAKSTNTYNTDYLNNLFNYKVDQANQKAKYDQELALAAVKNTTSKTGSTGSNIVNGALPEYVLGIKGIGDGQGNMLYSYGGKTYKLKAGYNPFTGTKNKDIEKGFFSNGYQPDNVSGYKLKQTGYEGDYNGQSQNIWKYTDKDGKVNYVYWDGTKNVYRKTKNPASN